MVIKKLLMSVKPEFQLNQINIVSSKSVRIRNYFFIPLPFDPETWEQHLFYIHFHERNKFDLTNTFYFENKREIPILEIFSFIFADKDLKLSSCQNIIKTPDVAYF